MSEKHHSLLEIWVLSDGEDITDQSKTLIAIHTLKYTYKSYKYQNTHIYIYK